VFYCVGDYFHKNSICYGEVILYSQCFFKIMVFFGCEDNRPKIKCPLNIHGNTILSIKKTIIITNHYILLTMWLRQNANVIKFSFVKELN
jgi:hypothetical protein